MCPKIQCRATFATLDTLPPKNDPSWHELAAGPKIGGLWLLWGLACAYCTLEVKIEDLAEDFTYLPDLKPEAQRGFFSVPSLRTHA